MSLTNFQLLKEAVIPLSNADNWGAASTEWQIIRHDLDEDNNGRCVCSKVGLTHLYTIENIHNGNTLAFIGSRCIKRFLDDDMDEYVKINEKWGDRKINRGKYDGMTFDEALRHPGIHSYFQALTGEYAPTKKVLKDFVRYYRFRHNIPPPPKRQHIPLEDDYDYPYMY